MDRLIRLGRRYFYDFLVLAAAGSMAAEMTTKFLVPKPAALALLLAAPLFLFARRWFPFGAPFMTIALIATGVTVEPGAVYDSGTPFFLTLLSAWTLGNLRDLRRAVAGLPVLVAYAIYVTDKFPQQGVGDFFWVTAAFSTFWVVGFLFAHRAAEVREVEERARRLELAREEEARRAVSDERRRIARELHDVVAHNVSVMTVQAGAVRRLLHDDQMKEREALEVVEETGRAALAEMRRLLGMLKDANETPTLAPQPSLKALDGLLGQVREAGMPVELSIEGDPFDLPPGIDLSAYRIVQEALTNALKHAGPATAEVWVRYAPDAVELEIANDGRSAGNGDNRGYGIAGMRERVAVFGGELETGPRRGGGYVVKARLPVTDMP